MLKRYFSKKIILNYLYSQFLGRALGFMVGMWATGIVSNFFETKSIRNLWGITAKKTVVDKGTYENIEWLASLIIGFIVFEVVQKILVERLSGPVSEYLKKTKDHYNEKGLKETGTMIAEDAKRTITASTLYKKSFEKKAINLNREK